MVVINEPNESKYYIQNRNKQRTPRENAYHEFNEYVTWGKVIYSMSIIVTNQKHIKNTKI